jgi:hypothetical protein
MDHVTILFLLSCPLSLYETIWAHMGHMIYFLFFGPVRIFSTNVFFLMGP